MVLWRLVNEANLEPSRFGDLTYPQIICLLNKGKTQGTSSEAWKAKKVLKDFQSGKYAWDDEPIKGNT